MNLSWILDFAENVLPLTGDPFLDSVLFYGIGVVSLRIAWYVAGQTGGNSIGMSIVHWLVRIIGFLILWAIVVAIYWFIRFLISIPWWGWIIIAAFGAQTIVGIVLLVRFSKKKKAGKNEEED